MQQILLIHGGNPFDTYEDYVSYLRKRPIYFNRFRMKDWKETLGQKLGPDFDVIMPQMPCKENAKYSEWKIWFERLIPFFEQEVVLIGHSLGGIFLAKWLSENKYPKGIKAVFLVATPYNVSGEGQRNSDFRLSSELKGFQDQAGTIFIYHSEDDPVVKFAEAGKYQTALPNAHLKAFKGMKHFNQAEFPEIVEEIRKIA